LALGTIPLAVLVSTEAHIFVVILGGQRYSAATAAAQLLMWAVAVSFFHLLAIRACTAANLERLMPVLTFITACVNVAANLLLIPRLNFVGAGIAAVVSESVGLCLYSALLNKHVPVIRTLGVVLRVVMGNLPMLAFLLWQYQTSPFLTVPAGIVLCVIGCMATRALTIKDVFTARSFLLTKRHRESLANVAEQATLIIPRLQDVGDWPTISLPRIQA
jgi:O-antigen/teichoic acid export membrane protein